MAKRCALCPNKIDKDHGVIVTQVQGWFGPKVHKMKICSKCADTLEMNPLPMIEKNTDE